MYGFDTASNTAPSAAGSPRCACRAAAAGGDMVFDSTGHLYIASAGSLNALLRVDQPIPATGTDAQLTPRPCAPLSVSSPNGVTFDGDGYLYVSSSSHADQAEPEHRRAGVDGRDRRGVADRQHRRPGRLPVQR